MRSGMRGLGHCEEIKENKLEMKMLAEKKILS